MSGQSIATPLISVRGIAKRFARSSSETQTRVAAEVKSALFPWRRGEFVPGRTDFWAVKDVSFEVGRGEAVGIIGFNGAGKTTLLRMLTGQILPDAGEVRLEGTSAALVDLTAGFQENLSGRENIFLRSAMLGRSRNDTERLYDDIVAFAELDEAIGAPVSTYSAGMKLRLAFATTIFAKPDILIVDEVLSVGDFRFRQKCLEYVRRLRENSAFVLVSHSMGDISRFCDLVLVLDHGQVVFRGKPADAIAFYEHRQAGIEAERSKPSSPKGFYGDMFSNNGVISDVAHTWCDDEGKPVSEGISGQPISLTLSFTTKYRPKNLIVGIPIYSAEGRMVTACSTEQMQVQIDAEPGRLTQLSIRIPRLSLVPGQYEAVVAIVDGPEYLYRQRGGTLTVRPDGSSRYFGDFTVAQEWTVHESEIQKQGSL